MAVESQGPRFEVSIPIRYSRDGRAWGEGIVTSLSGTNLFVQSTALPEVQSRLFLAIGMGEGQTYHGEARVTAHLNRDVGGMPAAGFGLKFDEAVPELTAAIARLGRVYPGAVAVDVDGLIWWPIATDPDVVSPGTERDGLALWSGGQAVATVGLDASPITRAATPDHPLADYLSMLRAVAPALADHLDESITLTYRGRGLAPTSGLPARVLASSLAAPSAARAPRASRPEAGDGTAAPVGDPGDGLWSLDLSDVDDPTGEIRRTAPIAPPLAVEPAEAPAAVDDPPADDPVAEVVAAQLRIVDALVLAGWRFQRLTPELVGAVTRDEEVLAAAGRRIAALGDVAGLDESPRRELGHAVEDLGMVITRAAWHSTALEPAEVSQSAYDAWQVEKERQARQAAVAARAGTRDGDGVKSGARKDREDPRKAVPKRDKPGPDRDKRDAGARADAAPAAPVKGGKALPPWAVAVGALFTVAMVSGIVALSTGGHRDPPPPTRVDAYDVRNALEQVAPHVPFVSAKVDDAGLHVVIGSDWMSRTTSQRQADVENMTLALTNLRFETIHYATPDGTEHATFRGGSYVIAGQQQAEPVEK